MQRKHPVSLSKEIEVPKVLLCLTLIWGAGIISDAQQTTAIGVMTAESEQIYRRLV